MSTALARAAQNLVGVVFEGDVMMWPKQADGLWGNAIGPVSPIKLAISPGDAKITTRPLRLRGMFGQRADPFTSEAAESTLVMETDDASKEVILLALRGTSSLISEAGGTVTNGVTAVKEKGTWLQLPNRNIVAAGFAGKHANDTALTAGTDYVLENIWLQHGLIWIPSVSTIAANEACKWSYTYKAVTGTSIQGSQIAQVTMKIEMFGVNRIDSRPVHVLIHETTVNKATEIDFAANGYIKPNFSGVMTTPVGKSSPYEIEYLTFAV